MKKVLIITITRNRLETTKKFIKELREKAGYDFKQIVVDNGSKDGTVEWLKENGFEVVENKENVGIIKAWVQGVNYARSQGFDADYIGKFDDDCKIETENILASMMSFFLENGDDYVIAPMDLNILPDYVPAKVRDEEKLGSFDVRITTHTGGMFTLMSKAVYDLMANQNDGQGIDKDINRGGFWRQNGIFSVYLKKLKTYHEGIGKSPDGYKF